MEAIDRMIEEDRASPRRVVVLGDTMTDLWCEGETSGCQEGCLRTALLNTRETSGGAANAARQLEHWCAEAVLIGPWPAGSKGPAGTRQGLTLPVPMVPTKTRFLSGGRVVFRADHEPRDYGLGRHEMAEARHFALRDLAMMEADALLLCDYQKGFLDEGLIAGAVSTVRRRGAPAVADAKRPPAAFAGALLKVNSAYYRAHREEVLRHGSAVVTRGVGPPFLVAGGEVVVNTDDGESCPCVNHVGAGDSFAAHLTLALAHGLTLHDAALIAHAAGRVFVRHPHARPPWPHEVRRELLGEPGKILDRRYARQLRASLKDRSLVVANGVFRVPHAGHCGLLSWAKAQGDVLVVAVNDDASAARTRPGGFVLPLAERARQLAALACVDWVMPFEDDTPCGVLSALKADVLVKGPEYRGQEVPGGGLVTEVRFAPEGPFPCRHSSTLLAEANGG
jgi:D-beta-D-heptose 7-phosphate kinase/D-beta-D-heptose 1-phosphate adenosyltransferase